MEERGEFTPPLYAAMPIRWIIPLRLDGTPRGEFISQGGERANKRGLYRVVPQVGRTRENKANLLADKSEYVLGYYETPSQAKRARTRHELFVGLAEECAKNIQHPALDAIVSFLKNWNLEENRGKLPEGFAAEDNMTFDVDGFIPAEELDSIEEFWANYNLADDAPIMNCLVTGERGPVERVLPSTAVIKGLSGIGGQSSGTYLVAANQPAFRSYGLQQSLTAPISRDAAERFGKSLNHLLSNRDSHIFVGPVAYVWWAKEKTGLSLRIVSEPEADPKSVRKLMISATTGTRRVGTEAEKFYCLALSASSARNTVRDWLETTIPEVERNIGEWFLAQEIVDYAGQEAGPLRLSWLAASAYRDASKEMQPAVSAAMMRVALNGGRLPHDLLARAVRRCVVGTARQDGTREHVTRERAALIKLILTKQERLPMSEMKSLNEEPNFEGNELAAYNCGRLLAELEAVQIKAQGRRVNTTVIDRYYGAASTTPSKVIGLLMSNAQDHLSKIRKKDRGAYEGLQRRIEEIVQPLKKGYPNTLSMSEQGLFALGYYHQRAKNRADAKAASDRKNENSDGEES
jgi:CRISPR-associated protein Csd1